MDDVLFSERRPKIRVIQRGGRSRRKRVFDTVRLPSTSAKVVSLLNVFFPHGSFLVVALPPIFTTPGPTSCCFPTNVKQPHEKSGCSNSRVVSAAACVFSLLLGQNTPRRLFIKFDTTIIRSLVYIKGTSYLLNL